MPFCNHCAIELDFKTGDFAGFCHPGTYVMVICEDCGHCIVDYEGNCVALECTKKHGEKNANK